MPTPATSLATLRPELGSAMEFDLAASQAGFIGLRVLPAIDVALQSGAFGKLKLEHVLQSKVTDRAPGTGYSRGNQKFDDDSYACKEHGEEEPVDDRESQMYANYIDAEMFAAIRARDAVLRNHEIRVAAAIFNTSTWTPTTVVNEWDDAANATPITDVEARVKNLYNTRGIRANALIINWSVFRNLRNVDQIVDRINSAGAGDRTEPGDITARKLAEVFDLQYVLVGDAQKNAANEAVTASLSPIWSNEYAAVCRIATTNDIREVCVGRTFHWSADGSMIGGTIESYREEQTRSEIIRCRMDTDEKIIYTSALELLDNITT